MPRGQGNWLYSPIFRMDFTALACARAFEIFPGPQDLLTVALAFARQPSFLTSKVPGEAPINGGETGIGEGLPNGVSGKSSQCGDCRLRAGISAGWSLWRGAGF